MGETVRWPEGKLVLGMVHLQPLPGTPYHREGSLQEIVETAVASARALRDGGADGCLVQTVDRVYSTGEDVDPARLAAFTLVVRAVVAATGPEFLVGVQVMRNAVRASLAVAKVTGAGFVRVGALVGATLTSHGLVQPDPLAVMEYRRKIGAWDVRIIADIASMHFTWLGGGKPVAEVAAAARQVGADAVAVSSPREEVALDLVAQVRTAVPGLPILLAGHTNHDNAARLLGSPQGADGAFVGTCLERAGWGSPIDAGRVETYLRAVRGRPGA
ncbi:BtpA/SgcQ family protein [Nonomuraea antimicrobica]|uniref:BtpA/SgcQ family protein n=1 Tax=Nonomuraea antimicrobica TaxID=561173 RepID=A0ABP7B2F6_9ACTN